MTRAESAQLRSHALGELAERIRLALNHSASGEGGGVTLGMSVEEAETLFTALREAMQFTEAGGDRLHRLARGSEACRYQCILLRVDKEAGDAINVLDSLEAQVKLAGGDHPRTVWEALSARNPMVVTGEAGFSEEKGT